MTSLKCAQLMSTLLISSIFFVVSQIASLKACCACINARAIRVSILDLLPENKKGGLPNYLMSVKSMMMGAWILFPIVSREQSVICPKCGMQVLSSSNYCNFCGARLRQPRLLKICSKCGSRMEATAKFCPECGQKQPRIRPELAVTTI